ncbi:MAG: PorT family protein [Flavobacteriaceae bacterium]|jgi:hypothetical protein|nr:PorT family protein [Flavobacteriaceae bacterium]
MKKGIIFVVFLLLSAISYSQHVKFGVRGTAQRTNVSRIHRESEGRMAGSLGVLVQIPVGWWNDYQFFIQPEVSYSLQGEYDQGNTWGYRRDGIYFQDYINIPIFFRTYASEADSEFFVELGPQLSFLVYEKQREKETREYNVHPKKVDLSIGVGVGYSFLRRYEIFARYNYGMIDAYKGYYSQQRTSNLAVGLAYMFN